jgi:hypothetical protein
MRKQLLIRVMLAVPTLAGFVCSEPPPRTAVVHTENGACPSAFVSLAGLGSQCPRGVSEIAVPSPCFDESQNQGTVEVELFAKESGDELTPGTLGIAAPRVEGRSWVFSESDPSKSDWCGEPKVVTVDYKYWPEGIPSEDTEKAENAKASLSLLFSGIGGHTLDIEASSGLALTLETQMSAAASCNERKDRCAGVLAPGGSVEFKVDGQWSARGNCPLETTESGFKLVGPPGSTYLRCLVSSESSIVVDRAGYIGQVEATVGEEAMVAGSGLEVPGGSNVTLRALDASVPDLSWECRSMGGAVISAQGPEISLSSVRTDYTCTVTACEPPTVTLEATEEDGSPLVDLDTTTTSVIDLEPTTSVLFKVSGDGFEPTSMVTLLVNGGAIDEFVGEKTIVMQEILSSDAAYDLQAEVQACGAAVRSPAIQLRRM